MNKFIVIGVGILVLVGGFFIFAKSSTPVKVGFDRSNTGDFPALVKEYDQEGLTAPASRSQQGLVKNTSGRIVGFEITSDAQSLRYFQLFDMTTPVIPSRAASMSTATSLKIYKASLSWASLTAVAAKPIGSWQQYASPSMLISIPVPGATSSTSPTIVRIGSDFLSPAMNFANGIIFGISSVFGSYSSASVNTARHTVRVLYE